MRIIPPTLLQATASLALGSLLVACTGSGAGDTEDSGAGPNPNDDDAVTNDDGGTDSGYVTDGNDDDDETTPTGTTDTGPFDCVDVDLGFQKPPFTWTGGTVDESDDDAGSCGGEGVEDIVFRWSPDKGGLYAFELTDNTRMDAVIYTRPDCGLEETACVNATEFGGEVLVVELLDFEEIVITVDGGRSYVELNVLPATATEVECRDGNDSDFDGLLDCLDPDCFDAAQCAEDCGDGKDNNETGQADCLDPICFKDALCFEDCANGIDDNGDGVFDCDDPIQCSEAAECQPGCPDVDVAAKLPQSFTGDTVGNVDDEELSCGSAGTGDVSIRYVATVSGDHVIDTVGSDYDASFSVTDGCATFDKKGKAKFTPTELLCADDTFGAQAHGVVNMKKGQEYILHVDGNRDREGNFVLNVAPLEKSESNCLDGRDLDDDGLVDCLDSDCFDDIVCEEFCDNLVDDNGTGLVDCDDGVCGSDASCTEQCGSGFDEDEDGTLDCDDTDCAADALCSAGCPDYTLGVAPGSVFGTTATLPDDSDPTCGDSSGGGDLQIEFTAPTAGDYIFDTNDAYWDYDTVLAVRDACPGSGTELVCNDDNDGSAWFKSQATVTLDAGEVVVAEVEGLFGDEGYTVVNVVAKEDTETSCTDGRDNDGDFSADCDDTDCATDAACKSQTCPSGASMPATSEPFAVQTRGRLDTLAPSCSFLGVTDASDLTMEFTASVTGTYTFATEQESFDTVLVAYDKCGGTELACSDTGVGDEEIELDLVEGDTIILGVGGAFSDSGFTYVTLKSIDPEE